MISGHFRGLDCHCGRNCTRMVVNSRFKGTLNRLRHSMQAVDNTGSSRDATQLKALTERVARSPLLKRSPRLQELFQYLVKHSVNGSEGDLREQTIGEEVFGRARGYDTGADNIVRVSVFQLRKKLDQYFSESGMHEDIVASIPKGRYVVEFHPRVASEPLTVPASGPEPLEAPFAPPEMKASPRRVNRRWWIAAIAALVALGGVSAVLWVVPSGPATPPAPASKAHFRLWKNFFGSGSDAYVVVGDVGFSLVQDVSGVKLGLDDYVGAASGRVKPQAGALPSELANRLLERQYTSVSNSAVAFRLGEISHALGGRGLIRSARSIDVRDLKYHNVVLLGSSRSNPWVDLLKDRMNFQIDYESSPPRGFVRNRNPRSGEPAVFRATAVAGKPGEAFGLIAYLPNLDQTGKIVSIAGTNMEGTEAAAETLLNERSFKLLEQHLNAGASRPLPYFEVVIRSTSIGGAGSSPEVVAVRVHPQTSTTRQ